MARARHRAPRTRWFGRGRTRALLSAGLLLGTGAVATSAYWTDKETVPVGALNPGALHIDVGGHLRVRGDSIVWPGASLDPFTRNTSRSAVVTVTNNSLGAHARFTYQVKGGGTDVTGALLPQLSARVWRGATSDGSTCNGGTLLGPSSALTALDVSAGSTGLAPGQSETICIELTRSGVALTTASRADLTFTFAAKQVHG